MIESPATSLSRVYVMFKLVINMHHFFGNSDARCFFDSPHGFFDGTSLHSPIMIVPGSKPSKLLHYPMPVGP
jgi:hypothetical protein